MEERGKHIHDAPGREKVRQEALLGNIDVNAHTPAHTPEPV